MLASMGALIVIIMDVENINIFDEKLANIRKQLEELWDTAQGLWRQGRGNYSISLSDEGKYL